MVYLLQFCSSDISPQSLSPSQIHRDGIQRPMLLHLNMFGAQVRPAVHQQSKVNKTFYCTACSDTEHDNQLKALMYDTWNESYLHFLLSH